MMRAPESFRSFVTSVPVCRWRQSRTQKTFLEVPDGLFQRRPDLFLRVTGDSMKDAGILEGDLIAVVLQAAAESGDIVVARLDNEITVKRLRIRGKCIELVAANAAYAPIRIDSYRGVSVEGRVLGVVRRF